MKINYDNLGRISEVKFDEGENQEVCAKMLESIERKRLSRTVKVTYDNEGRLSEVNVSDDDIAEAAMRLVESSVKEHYAYLENNANKQAEANKHILNNKRQEEKQ